MPRNITVKARPKSEFAVPYSDGYSLYSALLSRINDHSPSTSKRIHDRDFSSISISSLDGPFRSSDRQFHKSVVDNELYKFQVGVTDTSEKEIFDALVKPLVLEEGSIDLTNGILRVQEFQSRSETFVELLDRGRAVDSSAVELHFTSPTCIQYKRSDVTEMFPHRVAVFHSLLSKWNQSVPDELRMDLDRDEIGENLIEKPNLNSLETHSVVVNRVNDQETGRKRNIIKQGFTGKCKYKIINEKNDGLKQKIFSLAMFGDYSGVGSAVSRGCGSMSVEKNE